MTTIEVTTNQDVVDASDGLTSLREALGSATSAGDLIIFNAGLAGATISLDAAKGPLTITAGDKVTIDGDINNDGLADITLDGHSATSLLTVEAGANATVVGIDFKAGSAVGGALATGASGANGVAGANGADGIGGGEVGGDGEWGGFGGGGGPGGDGQSAGAANTEAGAINNFGSLALRSVDFIGNSAEGAIGGGGGAGGDGEWGGFGGSGGDASAEGGQGGLGGGGGSGGEGGAGGNGGQGGDAAGAIANFGDLTLADAWFANNSGSGGDGGQGALGGRGGDGGDGGAGGSALNDGFGGLGGDGGDGGHPGSTGTNGQGGNAASAIANFGGLNVTGALADTGNNATAGGETTEEFVDLPGSANGWGGSGGPGGFFSGDGGHDGLDVPPETLFLNQDTRGTAGLILGGSASSAATTIFLALSNPEQKEGNLGTTKTFNFYVNRLGNISNGGSVMLDFAGGVGIDDSDFQGGILPTSQLIAFAPGEKQRLVAITVAGDNVNEGNESFSLSLSSPSSGMALASTVSQTATIENDDPLNSGITLNGGPGNDTLVGGPGDDTLDGGAGNDRLDGGAGNDTLLGGLGDDRLKGGTGQDTLDGGAGIDTADYSDKTQSVKVALEAGTWVSVRLNDVGEDSIRYIENVVGSSGNDALTGDNLANVLTGNAGNDILNGAGGNDTLLGGLGDDRLKGGAGQDTLDGGAGIDTADYSDKTQSVKVALNAGTWVSVRLNDLGEDSIRYIENIVGGSGGDALTGDNLANVLTGNAGNDILNGAGGNDTLLGGLGDDRLKGGTGLDSLDGGAGNDTADYSDKTQSVKVALNAGTSVSVRVNDVGEDSIRYIENIVGGSGADALTGDNLANVLTGNAGNDILNGAGGNDTLLGGVGNDRLKGGAGLDSLDGGAGFDTADYSDKSAGITVTLNGGTAAAVKVGGVNEDSIKYIEAVVGGSGNDRLTGDILANSLNGGAGNDRLDGGAGLDRLTGGTGNDTFAFDTALGSTNVDTISDFDTADNSIALDHTVFTGLSLGLLSVSAFSLDSATGSAPQIVYNHTTGALFCDSNGAAAGGSTQFATVTGAPTLDNTYFKVV